MKKMLEKEKMFSGTFLMIWQGRFVSALGDAVYSIAMGFWVLNLTGSTALMGSVMACVALADILAGPFAGVIVDRCNKKLLMIFVDVIMGLSVILIAATAFKGFLTIWMIFGISICLGIGMAFYQPALNSVIPDIVPKSRLDNANAFLGIVYSGSTLFGSTLGGYLYQMAGGPLIFLINGLSFFFSGIALLPAKIPQNKNMTSKQHFFSDMKDGFKYVWECRGLRYMIIMYAIQSFFFYTAIVLFLPLFNKMPGLGPTRYGIALGSYGVGMLIGMVVMSAIKIPPRIRLLVFMAGTLSYCLLFFFGIFTISKFIFMCALLILGGICGSVWEVMCKSAIQAAVSMEMRGKVSSLVSTVTQGLVPIAMASGGVLGEFFPYTVVIGTSFLINFFLFIPFAFNRDFKLFINNEPEKQVLEKALPG